MARPFARDRYGSDHSLLESEFNPLLTFVTSRPVSFSAGLQNMVNDGRHVRGRH
jgi:hypothetical protein